MLGVQAQLQVTGSDCCPAFARLVALTKKAQEQQLGLLEARVAGDRLQKVCLDLPGCRGSKS